MGEKDNVSQQGTSLGCLDGFANKFKDYVDGNLSEAKWDETWICVDSTVKDQLMTLVRGRVRNEYSRIEIESFAKNFLVRRGESISAELVEAVFAVKASLIGGSPNTITFQELNFALEMVHQIRGATKDLGPLLRDRKNSPSLEYSEKLRLGMVQAFEKLAAALETSPFPRVALQQKSVEVLVAKVAEALRITAPPALALDLLRYKGLLLASAPNRIDPEEWSQLTLYGGIALSSLMAYEHSVKVGRREGAEKLESAAHFAEIAYQKLKPLLKLRRPNGIPFPVLDEVLTAEIDWANQGVKLDTAKRTYWKLVPKLLRDPTSPEVPGILQYSQIDWLINNFHKFVAKEKVIDNLFKKMPNREPENVLRDISERILVETSPEKKEALTTLAQVIKTFEVLYTNDSKLLQMSDTPTTNANQVRQFHLYEQIVRTLFPHYANPATGMLNIESIDKLTDDIKDLGYQMHFIDPTVPLMGTKRIREADLFTPISNGDGEMNPEEAVYYLVYLMGASALADDFRKETDSRCAPMGKDRLDWNFVTAACFQETVLDRFHEFIDQFPILKNEFVDSTGQLVDRVKLNAITLALQLGGRRAGIHYGDVQANGSIYYGPSRYNCEDPATYARMVQAPVNRTIPPRTPNDLWADPFKTIPLGANDTRALAGLTIYIESVFRRFDKDRNGSLNYDEAFQSWQTFRGQISGVKEVTEGFIQLEKSIDSIPKLLKNPLSKLFTLNIKDRPRLERNFQQSVYLYLILNKKAPDMKNTSDLLSFIIGLGCMLQGDDAGSYKPTCWDGDSSRLERLIERFDGTRLLPPNVNFRNFDRNPVRRENVFEIISFFNFKDGCYDWHKEAETPGNF